MNKCSIIENAKTAILLVHENKNISDTDKGQIVLAIDTLLEVLERKQNEIKEALAMIQLVYKLSEELDNKLFEISRENITLTKELELFKASNK